MKQNKQQRNWKQLPAIKKHLALIAFVVLLILGQLGFDVYILFRVWLVPPDTTITERIVESAERFSNPGVVDPVAKKVFIPEANVVLPYYPSGVTGIRYGYSGATAGGGASLFITSSNAMYQAADAVHNAGINRYAMEPLRNERITVERTFAEVPNLQACARGFEVVFGNEARAESDNTERIDSRRLADSRTITIFREKGCPYQPDNMTNYVKQLQSY